MKYKLGLGSAAVALLLLAAGPPAMAQNAADIAVEAAKKFSGSTLNVLWSAGLQANDPVEFSGPLFEKLTGVKINMVLLPLTEQFSKMLIEHRARTGTLDVLSAVPAWLPDLIEAGALEPLDDFIDKYDYREEFADIAPVYRVMGIYKGKIYGLQDDGDVLIHYYRKDLFADAGNQSDFKAKYGYDLVPPTTWEQFSQISEFFTDKFAPDLYGSARINAPGLVHFMFQERFRNNGGKFFDGDTMKAQIGGDIGVGTLQTMIDEHAHMPPGVEAWGPIEVLSAWMAGDLAMMGWWPPPGRWSAGYGTEVEALAWLPKSTVAGKVGYTLPPGGAPQLAAGFVLAVSSDSKQKELAYLFAQWMNSKEISLQRAMLPFALRDPFRTSHFESAEYKALWPAAPDYLKTLQEAADAGLADLSIRSTAAYEDALTRAISAAFGGTSVAKALGDAAKEWDDLTKRIGMDDQKSAYNEWASKSNAYPK